MCTVALARTRMPVRTYARVRTRMRAFSFERRVRRVWSGGASLAGMRLLSGTGRGKDSPQDATSRGGKYQQDATTREGGKEGGGDGAALRAEFGADAVRKRTLVESFVGGEAASAVKRSTHFVL